MSKQVKPTLNYENSNNNIPNLNSDILHIKIASPLVGQLVPVSSNLLVTGTSSDTASTNCKVYAGLNGYNLYQPAIAAGPGGVTDYSKWYFKYTPTPTAYYAITPGGNTLIAKLTCNGNPSLVKYATTDITGIVAGLPPPVVIVPSSSASTAYTSYDPVPSTSSYTTHSSAKVHKVHDSSSSSDGGAKVTVRKVRDSSSSSDGGSSKVKIHKIHPVVHIRSSSNTAHTSYDPVPSTSSYTTHSSAKVHKVHDSSSSSDGGTKVKVRKVRDSSSSSSSDGGIGTVILMV